MKLEIVKETSVNGNVFYQIEVDGVYLKDSLSMDLSKVKEMHDRIVQTGKIDGSIKEILQTTEI